MTTFLSALLASIGAVLVAAELATLCVRSVGWVLYRFRSTIPTGPRVGASHE